MANMWCETCRDVVAPCGWCKGAGRRSEAGRSVWCQGCDGTGKFCKHKSYFTVEQNTKLLLLKTRHENHQGE